MAVDVLVMAVFNAHHRKLHFPLQAFTYFICAFASLDWSKQAVGIWGVYPRDDKDGAIDEPGPSASAALSEDALAYLSTCAYAVRKRSSSAEKLDTDRTHSGDSVAPDLEDPVMVIRCPFSHKPRNLVGPGLRSFAERFQGKFGSARFFGLLLSYLILSYLILSGLLFSSLLFSSLQAC